MELVAKDLACVRAGRKVFEGLSFSVGAGRALALRGPNGTGKTSLLRLVAGLGEPTGGNIELIGAEKGLSTGQHCHFIAHQNAVKPALTVEENLSFWRDFLGGGSVPRALSAFDLEALAPYSAGLLSQGQARRLSLARLALIARPVWLLDEPTVGLDEDSLARLAGLMNSHLSGGGIIIAATHVKLAVETMAEIWLGTAVASE